MNKNIEYIENIYPFQHKEPDGIDDFFNINETLEKLEPDELFNMNDHFEAIETNRFITDDIEMNTHTTDDIEMNTHTTHNIEMNETADKPIIRNIVISGGGAFLYTAYGILKETANKQIWDIKNLKTIYATSAGAILSYIIALNYDWETIDNYLINRPWDKVFEINAKSILNSFKGCGILGIQVIEKIFEPLLKAKDMSLDINLKDFYEKTGIEIHSFSTELTEFEIIDISYKTHPTWKITEAIYCSSCLPILFIPYRKDNKVYLDGGFLNNYPLNSCIDDNSVNKNEILGINKIMNKKPKNSKVNIDDKTTLFDYISLLFSLIFQNLTYYKIKPNVPIPNEIFIYDKPKANVLYDIYDCSTKEETRRNLIKEGQTLCSSFVLHS